MIEEVTADPRRRRRMASALVVYGLVGTLLLGGLLAATLYAALQLQGWADRIGTARDEVVLVLESARGSLEQAAGVTDTAGSSVEEAADAIDRAAELARLVADGAGGMAGLADFEILGRKPFGGLGPALDKITAASGELATTLEGAGATLGTGAERVGLLGEKVLLIEERLGVVEARLASVDLDPGASVLLAFAVAVVLIGWLMVQAIVALVLGLRLRRG